MLNCNTVRYLLAAVLLLMIANRREANGEKIDARIDVGLMLAPGSDDGMHVVPNAYKKLVEHFKMGEDSVRVAIYSAVWTPRGKRMMSPRVVLDLTTDEQSIQQALDKWKSPNARNWTLRLNRALNTMPKLLRINTTEGDQRAKAVVVVLTAAKYKRRRAINAAKSLRNKGVWIYVVAPERKEDLKNDAWNISENRGRVFLASEQISDAYSAEVEKIMERLAYAIRNDLSRSVSGSTAKTRVTTRITGTSLSSRTESTSIAMTSRTITASFASPSTSTAPLASTAATSPSMPTRMTPSPKMTSQTEATGRTETTRSTSRVNWTSPVSPVQETSSATSSTPPRSSTTEERIAPWLGPVMELVSCFLLFLVIVTAALVVIAIIDKKQMTQVPGIEPQV